MNGKQSAASYILKPQCSTCYHFVQQDMAYIPMLYGILYCEQMFQNMKLNAAHHLQFLVETLWSPKTMLLIKFPKVWVSMTAVIFCLCILRKACITWHFWATNRKLTFSWKITPLGAIPPLNAYISTIKVFFRRCCSRPSSDAYLAFKLMQTE